MNYKISHPTKVVNCEIDLPSSKSISNRLLIIQALCKENFMIENLSDSDDTKSLELALNSKSNLIDVGAAGTTFRFLTSYLSTLVGEEFILTGTDRMKERQIKELVDSLKELDAQIEYIEEDNFPPLKIKGAKLKGNKIKIDGSVSSQFISSILLVSPTIKGGLELKIKGNLVSKPYVLMTLKLMSKFGINWDWIFNKITIEEQNYKAQNYTVESDWSAATFWFQIASLSENCNIKLNGLAKNSIQGDKKVRGIFKNLGVESEFANKQLILTKIPEGTFPEKVDFIETPDIYQSLKCTLFAKGISTKTLGIQTLKNKETNRISAVENEIKKLHQSKIIETYNDHRMAMSFAPLCLKYGKLQINNAEVVSKSYPNFWEDLKKGGFKISF
ncbi:MAG: 3-phosphoshikimate 1-carboxyvinyltransferase [Flavobacteriales bacterium]|nr:3-phosphoshikimate 1-carboxyvinyltransferase [Flavobacteriales bacterium]